MKPRSDTCLVTNGLFSMRRNPCRTSSAGSGKASALKAFEDLGYYSVDNLPLELVEQFADLVAQSMEITRAALVIDVREGMRLDRFPAILKS